MPENFPQKLLLAKPRGFCVGVKRAINALNEVKKAYPAEKIYCYHQIVHNTHIVNEFEKKGVYFIDNLGQVPQKSVIVFSAHGIPPQIRQAAMKRKLKIIDAACPYVLKTHLEIIKYAKENYQIIYLGKKGHDEAFGATSEAPKQTIIIESVEQASSLSFPPQTKLALVTQTTLSFDETAQIRKILKDKFPKIVEPPVSDICLATQNRQNGVKKIVKMGAEIVVVLGSPNSSNSKSLKKTAESLETEAYLIDDISELHKDLFLGKKCIGLTAGASLPENKIQQALEWFKQNGSQYIEEVGVADESKIFLAPVKINN